MYSVRYTKTAEDCFARLSPEQRRAVIRIVANVQLDPIPDDFVKFTFYELGTMYTIYLDHLGHWAVYHVDGNIVSIVIVGAGGYPA